MSLYADLRDRFYGNTTRLLRWAIGIIIAGSAAQITALFFS